MLNEHMTPKGAAIQREIEENRRKAEALVEQAKRDDASRGGTPAPVKGKEITR